MSASGPVGREAPAAGGEGLSLTPAPWSGTGGSFDAQAPDFEASLTAETSLRDALMSSGGDYSVFVDSGITIAVYVLLVLAIGISMSKGGDIIGLGKQLQAIAADPAVET